MTALFVKQDFEADVSAWGITPEWEKKTAILYAAIHTRGKVGKFLSVGTLSRSRSRTRSPLASHLPGFAGHSVLVLRPGISVGKVTSSMCRLGLEH